MRRFFCFLKKYKARSFYAYLNRTLFQLYLLQCLCKNAGRLKSFIIDQLFCNENIIPTTVQTIADDVSTIASKA